MIPPTTITSNLLEIKARIGYIDQGICRVEPHRLEGWYTAHFPDHTLLGIRGKTEVIRECNAWARKQPLPPWGIGVLTLEWQGLGIKEVTTPINLPVPGFPPLSELA